MNNDFRNDYSDYLMHYGIKGMKWDHHIYKKKEDQQAARPGRPGRQTGYQHASNAVQMVQNVSRDGLGNTVLQDAAARIPHFQPVGGPVNISGKKNSKAKSAVNQRDQQNNKREVASEIHQMAKKNNQSKKDAVGHFVNQFIQNSQHQRENPLGNAAREFMQNSQHHNQNANPVLDLVQGKKRRKKQGR